MDMDDRMVEQGRANFKDYGARLQLIHANFGSIAKVKFRGLKEKKFDFMLADLGYNNQQLEQVPGLSYTRDSALDMRYGGKGRTAAQLLKVSSVMDLAQMLKGYADVKQAVQIAQRIKDFPEPILTTQDLIKAIVGPGRSNNDFLLVSKVFQALRTAVNGQLTSLKSLLQASGKLLGDTGLGLVIGFNSIEHRLIARTILKNGMKIVNEQAGDPQANTQQRSARLFTFSAKTK